MGCELHALLMFVPGFGRRVCGCLRPLGVKG